MALTLLNEYRGTANSRFRSDDQNLDFAFRDFSTKVRLPFFRIVTCQFDNKSGHLSSKLISVSFWHNILYIIVTFKDGPLHSHTEYAIRPRVNVDERRGIVWQSVGSEVGGTKEDRVHVGERPVGYGNFCCTTASSAQIKVVLKSFKHRFLQFRTRAFFLWQYGSDHTTYSGEQFAPATQQLILSVKAIYTQWAWRHSHLVGITPGAYVTKHKHTHTLSRLNLANHWRGMGLRQFDVT
eukprot:sb/3469159/